MEKESIFNGKNKIKIQTNDSFFLNSDTLFVEYRDIIRPIDFILLLVINRNKEKFESFLNFDEIDGLEIPGLFEWYINRENQNIFYELATKEAKMSDFIDFNKMREEFIEIIDPEMFRLMPQWDFIDVVKQLSKEDKEFIHHIKIWHPTDSEVIKKDIELTFNGRVNFISGPLEEVLKNVSNDSTFVFSDITNICVLEELGKLNYSSILIPKGYQYNKCGDKLKIDIEEYEKNNIFKIDFFLF